MARKAITESQQRHLHDALVILLGWSVRERVKFSPKVWPVLAAAWEAVRLESEEPLAQPELAHKQAGNAGMSPLAQKILQP